MGLHASRRRPTFKRLDFDPKRWFLRDFGRAEGWYVSTPLFAVGFRSKEVGVGISVGPPVVYDAGRISAAVKRQQRRGGDGW